MHKQTHKQAFTLIEFLIALVIIGFIVAILVGVFSSPLKQAKTDSSVSQVKDGLRQWHDAAGAASAKYEGSAFFPAALGGNVITELDLLVSEGFLTAKPAVPAGIQTAAAAPFYWCGFPGGKGYGSAGTSCLYSLNIDDVTDDFCKAYNLNTHPELGSVIVPSCADISGAFTCAGGAYDHNWVPAEQCGANCCFLDSNTGKNTIIQQTSFVDNGWF